MSPRDLPPITAGVPAGEMDLTQVVQAWGTVRARLIPRLDAADEAYARERTALSARRFDESQPGGERTYIQAASLIRVALDNLDALDHLVRTRGATIWAPWNLLRAVFEPSAWANWLLDPEDGLERRRRGIRRAVLDQREWRNFAAEFTTRDPQRFAEMTERDTAITSIYRDEAAACGMPWDAAGRKLNLVDELPRLGSVRKTFDVSDHDPRVVVGLWRSLSGMAHGFPYAAQSNSQTLASIDIPGGQRVTYSINDTSFQVHALAATGLLVDAVALYIRRTERRD
jgi:hypothetical protein